MRIGFDVTPLAAPQGGVGTYTANLWHHLRTRPEDELFALSHRPPRGGTSQSGWPRNKTFWMQLALPWHLQKLALDICHFTNYVAPVWSPSPYVLTIHDMTLWLLPQLHSTRRVLSMRPLIPLAARRAAAIIANSEQTKRDLVRILGLPEHRVHVTYLAPAEHFRPVPRREAIAKLRQLREVPEHFVLHVGTIEPRKNLVRLVEAFALLQRHGGPSCSLLFAGHRGWKDEAVFAAVERLGLGDRVRFLGHVPAEELVALYNLADVLVVPSLYEGFGLPVIEAMACGTPVVTSPGGALAEVAGDAAELIDPYDVESIAAALRRTLQAPDLRRELGDRGRERAAHFTWSTTAAQTREIYQQVLAGSAFATPALKTVGGS
jgi:glycosyltransferase involved in cell wall biosynthesis